MFMDTHTHAFHPKIAHKVLEQLHGHYKINPVGTGVMDDLRARLDAAGIERFIVLSAATDPSQVIPANNWAIGMKEIPGAVPFGTMHPDFARIEQELDRLEQNGIKGLKFHPDFQGFRMDDPKFYNVMEAIGDRFVLMFHVGDVLPPDENPSCPKKLAQLRKNFPGPPMIAAHMGGYRHWEYAVEHLCGKDVYFDTSSTLDFVSDDTLKQLFNAHDRDHILFGSDYPLFDPGDELKKLQTRLSLSDNETEQILSAGSKLIS